MQVKQTIFQNQALFVDFHRTRGFYNNLPSSQLLKCGCELCKKIIEKLNACQNCTQCKNDFSLLGIELTKPIEISFMELNNEILISLVYQFEGRPFKNGENIPRHKFVPVYDVIKHTCNTCNLDYYIDLDRAKINCMLLKTTMEMKKTDIKAEQINKKHFAFFEK